MTEEEIIQEVAKDYKVELVTEILTESDKNILRDLGQEIGEDEIITNSFYRITK